MPDPHRPKAHAALRGAGRARSVVAHSLLPAVLAALAGCAGLPAWPTPADEANTPSAAALAHEAAQQRLHAAVQAAQPGQDRLATARRALEEEEKELSNAEAIKVELQFCNEAISPE